MVYLLKCTTGHCLCKLFQTFVKSCFPVIFCASYIGVEKYLKIDNTTRLKILYLKVWRLKRGSWFSSSCINSRKFYHLHFWNHTSFLLSSVKALQSCRGSIKNHDVLNLFRQQPKPLIFLWIYFQLALHVSALRPWSHAVAYETKQKSARSNFTFTLESKGKILYN